MLAAMALLLLLQTDSSTGWSAPASCVSEEIVATAAEKLNALAEISTQLGVIENVRAGTDDAASARFAGTRAQLLFHELAKVQLAADIGRISQEKKTRARARQYLTLSFQILGTTFLSSEALSILRAAAARTSSPNLASELTNLIGLMRDLRASLGPCLPPQGEK